MSNVLDDITQQQILALGRLGWSLRRIEQALAVRRETISGYLKAAGIAVHGRGRRSESKPRPAISEEVSTDLGAKPAIARQEVSTDPVPAPASPIASSSPPGWRVAATPSPSGRTWSTTTAFRGGMRVSVASSWPCAAVR